MEYLSKQRYDEIAAELNHLINVVYPELQKPALRETGARMPDTVKQGGSRLRRSVASDSCRRSLNIPE